MKPHKVQTHTPVTNDTCLKKFTRLKTFYRSNHYFLILCMWLYFYINIVVVYKPLFLL